MSSRDPASPMYRVLLVDDEKPLLETTAAVLESTFDVTTATSGEEAIAKLGGEVFDVVCTDYAMRRGGLTGLDVIAFAAALPTYVGRILLTATHQIGDSAGYYVLVKPARPERLLETVEKAGAQARRVAAPQASGRRRSEGMRAVILAEEPPAASGERKPRR